MQRQFRYITISISILLNISYNLCYALNSVSFSDTLKYLGHSSILIKTTDSKTIYIDPYDGSDYNTPADVILITHQHYDHNASGKVKQNELCTIISNIEALQNGQYKSFVIDKIKIEAVAAYNNYHQKAQCVGYVIEFNGIKIYHAGDTGKIEEMSNLAGKNITYALLPIDGIFTMTPEAAVQAASMIKAKYYIPIHTANPDQYNDAVVDRFTVANKIVIKPGNKIGLNYQTDIRSDVNILHDKFHLEQNYPNPFNPSTVISYQLSTFSHVALKVYDLYGREVVVLVNDYLPAGTYNSQFSIIERQGGQSFQLPSGVYFYNLIAGNYSRTMKMILLK